jgi:hypothetical protein
VRLQKAQQFEAGKAFIIDDQSLHRSQEAGIRTVALTTPSPSSRIRLAESP